MEGTNEKEQETKIKEIQNHETLSKYEPAGFLGQVSAMTNNKYMLSTFCLASQNTFLITVYNCYFFLTEVIVQENAHKSQCGDWKCFL